jgi:hypothetical protein
MVLIQCFVHSLHRRVYYSIFFRVCQVICSYSVQILCCNQCRLHTNTGYGGTPLTWCHRLRRGFIDNLLILKRFLNSNGLSLSSYFLAFFVAKKHHNNLLYNSTPSPYVVYCIQNTMEIVARMTIQYIKS